MNQQFTQIISSKDWKGYELIDSGEGEKLERFGDYVLIRPEPKALWKKNLSQKTWKEKAHAIFNRESDNLEKGTWLIQNMPSKWHCLIKHHKLTLHFKLSLTSFKHVGIFPEQASNWLYIQDQLQTFSNEKTVLNLFAYTGGASLISSICNAKVYHVDAIKNAIHWANENAQLNNLSNIHWVVEDALKFAKREVKRGKKYQGIILDPPAYGRGPDGERWVLEDNLLELLQYVTQLIDTPGFIILNLYSLGISPTIAETIFHQLLPKNISTTTGELAISDSFGKILPLSTYCRVEVK